MRCLRESLACLSLVTAAPAPAACPQGAETFLACTLEGGTRTLAVCLAGARASLSAGPAGGAPDLLLSARIADLEFQPWDGWGSSPWERVGFRRGGEIYGVTGTIERRTDEATGEVVATAAGSLDVRRDGALPAVLRCDPGTVDYVWSSTLEERRTADRP